MDGVIAEILRYPVKGLSAEGLTRATLRPGRALAGDRRVAIALPSPEPAEEGCWLPPERLITQARFPALARLDSRLEASGRLVIRRRGRQVVAADITTPHGRAVVSEFLSAFLGRERMGHPRLLVLPDDGFTDRPHAVSLLGSGTLAAMARAAGRRLTLGSLRLNLLISGLPAWEEEKWVGRTIRLGTARLRGLEPAPLGPPPVDPLTGEPDAALANLLRTAFGRDSFGILAEVIGGGDIGIAAPVSVEET